MIGTKFQKPLTDLEAYSQAAAWCNANRAMIEDKGDYYEVCEIPEPTDEEVAANVRGRRDALIAETDFLMMPDYPLAEDKKAQLEAYRQALRDIPQQEGFPKNVEFPEKPDFLKEQADE